MNLQLDHFSDDLHLYKKTRGWSSRITSHQKPQQSTFFAAGVESSWFNFITAPTTCRDGWLGFLFRWRTQQSAISGINCRIIQLPNLWTQMAHGRSFSRVIPVHAAFSVSNKKNPLSFSFTGNLELAFFTTRAHIWTKCGHSHMVWLGASEFRKELDEPRKKQPTRQKRWTFFSV